MTLAQLRILLFVAVGLGFLDLAQGAAPLRWIVTTGGAVLSSPVLARDGTIYVGSYDRKIYAVSPLGGINWSTNLPLPIEIQGNFTGIYGTPALGADGTIYVPAENGKLLALNPTNGATRWDYPSPNKTTLYSSPAVGPDGTIYFGFYDENLYAVNPNGTRKWESRFGSTIFTSPVVGHDGTIYSGCDDGKVYALYPDTGGKKWIFDTGNYAITASPALGSNDTLYIGVGSINNPKFYAISSTGATNWIFTTGSRIRSSAAVGLDGTIYFGCDDGKLYALHGDGTLKWDFPAGGAIGSSPAVARDGSIYFGCDDGKLHAVDSSGHEAWTFQTTNKVFTSPVIGLDGTIYFASTDGALYALQSCRPAAVSNWPMFRQRPERTGVAMDESGNTPPVLESISDRIVTVGSTLSFSALASDFDLPAQPLRFRLGAYAPAGASINETNGLFQWTPGANYGSTTNRVTIIVADSGSPALIDARCFEIRVDLSFRIQEINLGGNEIVLRWDALSNRTYRVQYKTNLEAEEWRNLVPDVTATGESASRADPRNPETSQRFYRVELLP